MALWIHPQVMGRIRGSVDQAQNSKFRFCNVARPNAEAVSACCLVLFSSIHFNQQEVVTWHSSGGDPFGFRRCVFIETRARCMPSFAKSPARKTGRGLFRLTPDEKEWLSGPLRTGPNYNLFERPRQIPMGGVPAVGLFAPLRLRFPGLAFRVWLAES